VTLTPDEIAWARENAAIRSRTAEERHYKRNGGTTKANSLGHDIRGMFGEVACETAWGVPHRRTGPHDREAGDVLGRGVRTTKPGGGIPVRPDEEEHQADRVLVLVWDRCPVMELVGWAYGREVVSRGVWRSDWDAPAWCLPWRLVHSMETIPAPLERKVLAPAGNLVQG